MKNTSLFFFIIVIGLFGGCRSNKSSLPAAIDFTNPTQLASPNVTGIAADRWVDPNASVELGNPAHDHAILLAGTNVQTGLPDETLRIQFGSAGRIFDLLVISRMGDFTEYVPLPPEIANRDTLALDIIPLKKFIPAQLGLGSDARTLTFRIAKIALVGEEESAAALPEMFRFPRDPETDAHIDGIYKDGWFADSATVVLFTTGGRKTLALIGSCPPNIFSNVPALEVFYDGTLMEKRQLTDRGGDFNIQLQLNDDEAKSGKHIVRLRSNGSFVPAERKVNSDTRKISYRIQYIGYK